MHLLFLSRNHHVRINLAKLLPHTFEKMHVSEMVINTADITYFHTSEVNRNDHSSFSLGNLKIHVDAEDYVSLNGFSICCLAEKVLLLTNLVDHDSKNCKNDTSLEDGLKSAYNELHTKYGCVL